jgi:hypothetical protein
MFGAKKQFVQSKPNSHFSHHFTQNHPLNKYQKNFKVTPRVGPDSTLSPRGDSTLQTPRRTMHFPALCLRLHPGLHVRNCQLVGCSCEVLSWFLIAKWYQAVCSTKFCCRICFLSCVLFPPPWFNHCGGEQHMRRTKWKSQGHFVETHFSEN